MRSFGDKIRVSCLYKLKRTALTSKTSKYKTQCRGTFMTLSEIQLKAFFENSQQLVVVDDFGKKSSILDLWKGSEYAFAVRTLVRNKLSVITA